MSDFQTEPRLPLADPKQIVDIVDDIDTQLVIFGEDHGAAQLETQMGIYPDLYKMGYRKIFLEAGSDQNGRIKDVVSGRLKISHTGEQEKIHRRLYNYGFQIVCVDYSSKDYFKDGFDKAAEYANHAVVGVHNYKTEKNHLVSQLNVPDDTKRDLVSDAEIALFFGDKTYQNFQDKWHSQRVPDGFFKKMQELRTLAGYSIRLIKNIEAYNTKRNHYMTNNIRTYLGKTEKALFRVGLSHANDDVMMEPTGQTVQAMLNNRYDIETLSVGLNGGNDLSHIKRDVWDIIEPSEVTPGALRNTFITPYTAKAHAAGLSDTSFYIDHYDDNKNFTRPDIEIHLATVSGAVLSGVRPA